MNNLYLEENMKLAQTFYKICKHSVSLAVSWYPLTSKFLANQLGISISTVYKRIDQLKEKGYIKLVHIMDMDEDGHKHIYNCYDVTDMGRQTDIYKKAYEEERKACIDYFGFDIGEVEDESR